MRRILRNRECGSRSNSGIVNVGGADGPRSRKYPNVVLMWCPLVERVRQVFIDGGELVIVHLAYGPPGHDLTQLPAGGILAGAEGRDELLHLPALDPLQAGP